MTHSPSECEVSLEISSDTRSLDDLRRLLGVEGSKGSRSRGDARPRGGEFTTTVLRIEPPPGGSIDEQLRAIADQLAPARLEAVPDRRVTFRVAVYFSTADATIALSPESLERIACYGATLEISSYPTAG